MNTSFSQRQPSLQLFWDSVSLGALKQCPRYYQLSIVLGWQPRKKSVDLDFGIFMHSGRERYYHARAAGASHDDALDQTLCYALSATWDTELQKPWDSQDSAKNRFTLVRSLVWYLDHWRDDPLETIHLASGKPAVELSFSFETDYISSGGEVFGLAGHLDRLVNLNGKVHPSDLKTTKHSIDQTYFSSFSPDNQFSLYSFATKVVYGYASDQLLLDAIQVGVNFSRVARAPIARTPGQLDEWYKGLGSLLRQAETYAAEGFWPLNEKACFRCAFRPICGKDPTVRELWLKSDYVKRVWDPLLRRGDI